MDLPHSWENGHALSRIRTPLGIKLYGNDTDKLQELAILMEQQLKP